MTSVPPLPPYWPKKPRYLRLRRLQTWMHLPEPLLLIPPVRRLHSLKRVHRNNHRHLLQPSPPQARHPFRNLLHHRSLPQTQVLITLISRTTTILIHTRPTIPLLPERLATRILTLRILSPLHCTQSIRRAIIHRCSPTRLLSIHPILLRSHLPHSITSMTFRVTKK